MCPYLPLQPWPPKATLTYATKRRYWIDTKAMRYLEYEAYSNSCSKVTAPISTATTGLTATLPLLAKVRERTET